jgi:flagellar hook-basal body complex protein FliE
MRIDSLITKPMGIPNPVRSPQKTEQSSFGETVKEAINKVNDLQSNADQFANKLASGDSVEIHQAMIAMQKASTALQFTVQVRNKIIDAYQEIMKTQV